MESDVASARGEVQTAYQILVATTREKLSAGEANLWNTGKVASSETLQIPYAGKALSAGHDCYWAVKVWNNDGMESVWSPPAQWGMGMLQPEDWKAQWISFRDKTPVHADPAILELPPARYYRKVFAAPKKVKRAIVYASALGNYRLFLNGKEVSDGYFQPGCSDYLKRTYYQAFDVTAALATGDNCFGAIVTEGWYAGYVGYGLLVGYGPNKNGKNFYGKNPALLAQIDLEYTDGSREQVATDPSWQVSTDGPIREADMQMGETYDARKAGAMTAMFLAKSSGSKVVFESTIPASENGSIKATFHDSLGPREMEIGFQKPAKLQAHPGVPVRAVQELPAKKMTKQAAGKYVFDLGQNFAGVVRLKVKGSSGQVITIRYGEMLHPNGRLMTENLRRARATDTYICNGDPDGESWTPQFTYHGFQYVELSGLSEKPPIDSVTGIVLTSDFPYESHFACSDPVMTQLWKNGQWTQKANFIDIPTDCPQRDERLGWMGDAQAFILTASYNADAAAFYTKWLNDVSDAQRDTGAYPDYCPYPMAHGEPKATNGAAWTDAGVICPWTVWKVYGDLTIIRRQWDSMTRFMEWRLRMDPTLKGIKEGNPWGDWLNVKEDTPIEYIDLCYHFISSKMMAEIASALGKDEEASAYQKRCIDLARSFEKQFTSADGTITVKTQTAAVLALSSGLIELLDHSGSEMHAPAVVQALVDRIVKNENRMATGFLGTKDILPALSAYGHHDLACQLFTSREFPSWAYEVENGATTVWERWDSYTKEHGFNGISGTNNAAMNSFSHYAFGAVMGWAYRDLAGIDTDGPGYQKILIRPNIPVATTSASVPALTWAEGDYMHHRGRILSRWERKGGGIVLDVTIPANTTATVQFPVTESSTITESGKPTSEAPGVKFLTREKDTARFSIGSGTYHFKVQ